MNREIKFRAWDTERRMFVPQGEVIFKDYGETYFEVVPNCLEYVGDKVHNGEHQYNRFELMQFTGIKDKNGTEIYEGDIVKFIDNPTGMLSGNYDVVIDAGFIGIQTKHQQLHLSDMEPQRWVEVIGNIYQNPELINS